MLRLDEITAQKLLQLVEQGRSSRTEIEPPTRGPDEAGGFSRELAPSGAGMPLALGALRWLGTIADREAAEETLMDEPVRSAHMVAVDQRPSSMWT